MPGRYFCSFLLSHGRADGERARVRCDEVIAEGLSYQKRRAPAAAVAAASATAAPTRKGARWERESERGVRTTKGGSVNGRQL